jgi:hypothetical protein
MYKFLISLKRTTCTAHLTIPGLFILIFDEDSQNYEAPRYVIMSIPSSRFSYDFYRGLKIVNVVWVKDLEGSVFRFSIPEAFSCWCWGKPRKSSVIIRRLYWPWHKISCSLVGVYQRFGESSYLLHQGTILYPKTGSRFLCNGCNFLPGPGSVTAQEMVISHSHRENLKSQQRFEATVSWTTMFLLGAYRLCMYVCLARWLHASRFKFASLNPHEKEIERTGLVRAWRNSEGRVLMISLRQKLAFRTTFPRSNRCSHTTRQGFSHRGSRHQCGPLKNTETSSGEKEETS